MRPPRTHLFGDPDAWPYVDPCEECGGTGKVGLADCRLCGGTGGVTVDAREVEDRIQSMIDADIDAKIDEARMNRNVREDQ